MEEKENKMSKKKPIEIEIAGMINVEPAGVYLSKVVKCGNGAMIRFFKKFIGEEVVVIRSNKMEEPKKKLKTTNELTKEEGKDIANKWVEKSY